MINVKQVQFKFGDYMSNAVELMKKDFGNFILAYVFCIILSIIPFCGLMAAGNFYKYCRKINRGEQASPGEIFNFDDFMPYFLIQLIILAAVFVIYIPIIISAPFLNNGSAAQPVFGVFFSLYAVSIVGVMIYFLLKGFYIPGLISLGKISDLKTAWELSKLMTKGNMLNILLFSIVTSFVSQLGVLACVIGILVTLPFYYVSHYFAYEDAMQQIEHDEIKEIGLQNEI